MNMSIEFIVGTIIGLIGLIPLVYELRKKFRKRSLLDLMKELVNNEITQKKQQEILRKISRRLFLQFGKKLNEEYINNFTLGKRKKEAVFEDICISNKIEPLSSLCIAFLGSDSPSIRERYYQHLKQNGQHTSITKANSEKIDKQSEKMPDKFQVVYLSELLQERYPKTCSQLISILDKHKISHRFLKATKDIWCKDYMPVQTKSGKLVQFRYEPSYLKGNEAYKNTLSDVKEVCKANSIQPLFSNINLDGGNVLICSDRAIISDRVFDENPEYTNKEELITEIGELLEAEVIIIPTQKDDLTGHADGMVRFVDRNTILGNDRKEEYKYWTEKMNKVVQKYGLNYLDIPFFSNYKDKAYADHAIGIYVNYLEVNDLIVIPIFEVSGNKDIEAIARIKQIFPDRKIETINCMEIGLEGGLLNCITWTVSD